jgi:putative ABC transport system permease protein
MIAAANALWIALDALRRNPLRTMLSTLGIVIGVAALVSVLSLGDGMERSARDRIAATTGLHAIVVEPRTREQIDGQWFPRADTLVLTRADLQSLLGLPGVESAALQAQASAEVRSEDGARRRMAQVTATSDARVGEIALSRELARVLTGGDSDGGLVGGTVVLAAQPLRVVELVAADPAAGAFIARISTDPQGTLPGALAGLRHPSIVLRASRVEDVEGLATRARDALAARHPGAEGRVALQTYGERVKQAAQGIFIFKLLMGAITGISLVVGGIGIMNVLIASVVERTREIGIRKAAGATDRDILRQFLAEAMVIAGAGGAVGVMLGLVAAFGVTAAIRRFANAAFLQASFTWQTALVAVLISAAVGLAAGTYPARRAARMDPIEAIRHE